MHYLPVNDTSGSGKALGMTGFLAPEERFLFGKGTFSFDKSTGADLFPLQLPLTGSTQNELMTRKACVFVQNSCTDGFSCALPC